jgi:hypothetical protein
VRSSIATAAAAFRAADYRLATGITSSTGPTVARRTLSNLALLCRRHHRAVHEEGYQLDRGPDGELRFRRPTGLLMPDVPPPSKVPADPVHALRGRNESAGLHLHAHTATPGWLGEHLNVGYAIDVLHPLAIG